MRLLERSDDGEFRLTMDFGDIFHRYAILSHTWEPDPEEVGFRDVIDDTGKKQGCYDKVRFCGERTGWHTILLG
jgi:hypothetical protein